MSASGGTTAPESALDPAGDSALDPAGDSAANSVPDPAAAPSLTASQAKALEAELKAIERELDQLDLPSDSDFSGIESELP